MSVARFLYGSAMSAALTTVACGSTGVTVIIGGPIVGASNDGGTVNGSVADGGAGAADAASASPNVGDAGSPQDAVSTSDSAGGGGGDAVSAADTSSSGNGADVSANGEGGSAGDASGDAAVALVGPGSASCATATPIPLGAATLRSIDLPANTMGAAHTLAAPCTADNGAEVFYQFAFSQPVIVYADTFGATFNTVLYLLSSSCAPITTSTMTGDAVCNDDACGTLQSHMVALLQPGTYKLGVTGRGAEQGAATVHFAWVLAPNGAVAPLPAGATMQSGTTSGSGNIQGLSPSCMAAGPEDSYWWTNCPADPGGTLVASTCGSATQIAEPVLEGQIPGSMTYKCNVDGCGLQSSLTMSVPAGAGLRSLSIDGETGSDLGAYTMTVTRP